MKSEQGCWFSVESAAIAVYPHKNVLRSSGISNIVNTQFKKRCTPDPCFCYSLWFSLVCAVFSSGPKIFLLGSCKATARGARRTAGWLMSKAVTRSCRNETFCQAETVKMKARRDVRQMKMGSVGTIWREVWQEKEGGEAGRALSCSKAAARCSSFLDRNGGQVRLYVQAREAKT